MVGMDEWGLKIWRIFGCRFVWPLKPYLLEKHFLRRGRERKWEKRDTRVRERRSLKNSRVWRIIGAKVKLELVVGDN